jgi:hypothetical protein
MSVKKRVYRGKTVRKNEEMRCTMKGRMLFIFNPRSGKGQIRNKLMDIIDVFVKGGYEGGEGCGKNGKKHG